MDCEDIHQGCKEDFTSEQDMKSSAVESIGSELKHVSIPINLKVEVEFEGRTLARSSDKPYQCDECLIQFRYLSGFKRHSKLHVTNAKQHSCRKCFQKFGNVDDLVIHEQTHIVEKPFICQHCSRRYKTAKSLKYHQISHHSERPYKCDQCCVAFHKFNELNEHQCSHSIVRKLTCAKCSEHFDSADFLKQHFEEAHAYDCYLCLKDCGNLHELNIHLMSHSTENYALDESPDDEMKLLESDIVTHFLHCESEPLVDDCQVKLKEDSSKDEDAVHLHLVSMNDHHEDYSIVESLVMLCETPNNQIDWNHSLIAVESGSGFEEDLVGLISKSPQLSNEHEKHVDLGQGGFEIDGELDAKKLCEEELFVRQSDGKGVRFKCQQCLSTFTRKSSLKRHVRQHTGERPYQCKVCARTFVQSGTLRTHMLRHMDEKLYKCDRCFKEFATPGDLNRHLRYHTGEKPYGCPECDRMFAERGHLRSHMRTHTGERPFACEECGRTFMDVSSRNRHVQVEHAAVKKYQCSACDKVCGSSYELKVHARSHTGEGLHFCPVCGKQFSCGNSMKQHMRRHTGEKPFQCHYCDKKFAHLSNYKSHMSQQVCNRSLTKS